MELKSSIAVAPAYGFKMTTGSVDDFITAEAGRGISEKTYARTRGYLDVFYSYLPDDKIITPDILKAYRQSLVDRNLSPVTISNYCKAINQYLRFLSLDELCYKRGRSYDLTGQTFGYLTALENVGKKSRADNYWLCKCRCGNTVEVTASQLVSGAAKSCGCLVIEKLQYKNQYIEGTQLNKFLEGDLNKSSRGAQSGYRNIYRKGDKWRVVIKYKGKVHYCGTYYSIEEAIRVRDRAMEEIVDDIKRLKALYEELHSADEKLPPNKSEFKSTTEKKERSGGARRIDNKSGCTGVRLHHGSWNASITHNGVRYNLGTYKDKSEAIKARKSAEKRIKNQKG